MSCCTRATLPPARAKASPSRASISGSQDGTGAASALRRMQRTVLRDSLSARLISGRVRPCALSTRTLLRISVGMMLGMALDVVAKSLEAVLHTSDGPSTAASGNGQIRGSRLLTRAMITLTR